MASTTEDKPSVGERFQKSLQNLPDTVQGSQAWNSIVPVWRTLTGSASAARVSARAASR